MSENLNNALNNIPIPESLDERIDMGFKKAKKSKYKIIKISLKSIAAALIIVILSINIVGVEKVQAKIKEILEYIPGYNIVVDKNSEKENLTVLKDKVFYKNGDLFINILASYKDENKLNLLIESNSFNKEVYLKTKNEEIIFPESYSRSGGGDFWEGNYSFEISEYNNEYILVLGEDEVDFKLEDSVEIDSILNLGNFASSKGIDIVAIKKQVNDKLMISLLSQSKEKKVYEYPFGNNSYRSWEMDRILDEKIESSMYILDKNNNKIYPDIPSSFGSGMSDFYFNIKDDENLDLIIPYVKIMYNDLKSNKVKLVKPKDNETIAINKKLELGQFEIDVIDIQRQKDELIIRFTSKSPENEVLEDLRIRGVDGYGIWFNEDTGYVEMSINEDMVGKRFSLFFESPTSLLLGDWKINLD